MMSAISFGFEIIHSGAQENLSAISPWIPRVRGFRVSQSSCYRCLSLVWDRGRAAVEDLDPIIQFASQD